VPLSLYYALDRQSLSSIQEFISQRIESSIGWVRP
jgi:hypothetical protein